MVSDMFIMAVLIPGTKARFLISKDMLKTINKETILIDVAVDQGGCIETTVPTTHDYPAYVVDEVIDYPAPNMPGAVPHTANITLTNATLFYVIQLATKGWGKSYI